MQTISTTDLRTDLTGLLQNLDEPLAITKHGKTVAWLVGPSYNPIEASEEPPPSADTSGDTEPVTSPSEPLEAMPEEDEEERKHAAYWAARMAAGTRWQASPALDDQMLLAKNGA